MFVFFCPAFSAFSARNISITLDRCRSTGDYPFRRVSILTARLRLTGASRYIARRTRRTRGRKRWS